jgi:hypothetical protein
MARQGTKDDIRDRQRPLYFVEFGFFASLPSHLSHDPAASKGE